jgi:hypothetical protein
VGKGTENKEDKTVEEILITVMHLFSARWWARAARTRKTSCGGDFNYSNASFLR